MFKKLTAAFALATMLTGATCQGGPGTNTAIGALAGAGAGAALGTLAGGNDRRNALVGAGIGLLVGSAIGYYLDEQERQLQSDLRGTGASVTRTGNRVLVTMPASVAFAVDSASLKQRARNILNRVARTLNSDTRGYVDVIGHTDNTGAASYNLDLSERRATSVARHLRKRGVDRARLYTEGRGESEPIATNATPQGRAANRRVEIYVTPAT